MSGTLTVDGLRVPMQVDKLAAFRKWVRTLDEDGPRVHYSRGRVWIQMSPQDYFRHLALVSVVNGTLALLAKDLKLGRYWSDGGWLTNEDVGLSTEPDGFLVLWSTFESGDASYVERGGGKGPIELVGRGDMVLEVVSDSSVEKDTEQLLADYAAAAFPEYWLLDARCDPLSFRLLALQESGAYLDQQPDEDGYLASSIWQRRFRVETETELDGHPAYTLRVKPL